MKKKELLKRLREYQKWRKGANISQPDPVEITKVLDCAISTIEKSNTNEVNKILAAKEIIDEIKIRRGALILEGYTENMSCVITMDMLINKFGG